MGSVMELVDQNLAERLPEVADQAVENGFRENGSGAPAGREVSRAARLQARHGTASAEDLLAAMHAEFPGRLALVSSFGTSSVVLLHMVASLDPALPVLFLDTGKLFGETLRYRDRLVAKFGLKDVRSLGPDAALIKRHDADGTLWARDPDLCCRLRKVEPLERALEGFSAWITGRRREQGGLRSDLPPIEEAAGRLKINPLAAWSEADVAAYRSRHGLPTHPLEEDGYRSIGCMPCTDRVAPGEDARAGRWRNRDKSECGIHLPHAQAANRLFGVDA